MTRKDLRKVWLAQRIVFKLPAQLLQVVHVDQEGFVNHWVFTPLSRNSSLRSSIDGGLDAPESSQPKSVHRNSTDEFLRSARIGAATAKMRWRQDVVDFGSCQLICTTCPRVGNFPRHLGGGRARDFRVNPLRQFWHWL
jgi:hypothetical protein